MALHVSILGIDGSGKSTLAASLPAVLAAEMSLRVGSAGESFSLVGPDQDHLAPGFHPEGLPLTARLSTGLKRLAKLVVDRRSLYPSLKLAQMIFQDGAAQALARRYRAEVMVSDGNALLSATGRAANYLRPASQTARQDRPGPDVRDLMAVFAYVLEGKPLPPESEARLPRLGRARLIYRLCRLVHLLGVWLPDVILFPDISPETALKRIGSRRLKIDRHENEADLAQAREMYLKTLEAFQAYRGPGTVHRIVADPLSPGEVLRAAVEALAPRIEAKAMESRPPDAPLGTTASPLTVGSVWRKVFNYRYLVRYLLAHWFDGAWREPAFIFSSLGRLFLREGYSAGVMRAIYDQDVNSYRAFDRVFLGYPPHRAIYDRLQILTRRIEPELESRLANGRRVRVFSAPSGFADDLFRPLEFIARRAPELMANVEIVAADLDPHDVLAAELAGRAKRLGLRFRFLKGDMTAEKMRGRFAESAPYDLALFVGLSSWLARPDTVRHLRWLRDHLRPDGRLVTDCFASGPYALSGRYVGYRAQYYAPEGYRALVDYCGFGGLGAVVESGRDAINHVLVASPRLAGSQHA